MPGLGCFQCLFQIVNLFAISNLFAQGAQKNMGTIEQQKNSFYDGSAQEKFPALMIDTLVCMGMFVEPLQIGQQKSAIGKNILSLHRKGLTFARWITASVAQNRSLWIFIFTKRMKPRTDIGTMLPVHCAVAIGTKYLAMPLFYWLVNAYFCHGEGVFPFCK